MWANHEHAGTLDGPTGSQRALMAYLACAFMLLSSVTLASGEAVSDPVVVENPEDTCTVVWDFDNASDYILSGVEFSGGDATLQHLNGTDGDHSAEDYYEGDIMNLDLASIPGSAVIGSGIPDETYDSQPGPEGVDAYILENRPTDNYGSVSNMLVDSEIGKVARALLWFDVSSVPSLATISNATLWLYELSGSRGEDVVTDVYALSIPFVESEVTWYQSQPGAVWTYPGGDYLNYSYGTVTLTNGVGWVGIDLTELVEDWTDGAVENNGLILVPEPYAGDNQKSFQSSDDPSPPEQNPRLIVNYSIGGNTGLLQSRVMGPGTNATFTFASYDSAVVSRLDDGFSGTATLTDWTWMNAPLAYDVNLTRPGWLHIVGTPDTEIGDTTLTCNYMHQDVTGDFSASTYLEDGFTELSMGAGLLLYESSSDWMYVAKAQYGASSRIQVAVCTGGTSVMAADIAWPQYSSAHLRIDRNSTGIWFYASVDGAVYQLVHHHATGTFLPDRLAIGPFVYSGSLTSPVVEFDHFTVAFLEEPTFQVRARTGNSTSLLDESWEDWWVVPAIPNEASLGQTGKYFQYEVSMSSPEGWYTPVFSGLDFWYEMYTQSGMLRTYEHVPTDFSMWLDMTTEETGNGQSITYSYSTDGGVTWVVAGSGGSYSITSSEPSLTIMASMQTYDTLVSPRLHDISATHVTAVSRLVVTAPEVAVAGEPFSVTVTAIDASNYTMEHWTGQLTLQAVDVDGVTPLDPDLAITSAWIREYGSVTIPNEEYTAADTIVIMVAGGGIYGLSAPITILPGPISSLYISPTVDVMIEGSQQLFTAVARDVYGNTITDIGYSWSVEGDIGTLDSYNTSSVIFTAGSADTSGYVRVSAGGLTASLSITITNTANAPVFTSEVPDQTEYEDAGSWTIDLGPYVEDAVHQDADLRWFVTGENVIDVTGENRTGNMIITLSTQLDLAGTDTLTLYVVDPDGLWSITDFSVTILPVNDWPAIALVDPLVVRYDVLYIYNMRYYISDVDNDEEDLSMWVDDMSSAYVIVDDLALHMTYPAALNGTTQTIIVTVSDGQATASALLSVTVSDNYVPVLSDSFPGVDIYQGETLLDVCDLDDYFADPDGDDLYYSYWYSHVLVNISEGNMVNIFAPTDWYGSEYIVFTATDELGARVESAMTVLVHRVNQAPTIAGVPDLVVKHDLPYEFDLTWYVSDPDNDLDELHITTYDSHAVPAGLVLTLEYPETMVGLPVYLTLTVSDGELSDSSLVKVTVGDNAPPTVSALPMHSFQEDLPQPYPPAGGLAAYFSDEEGETLTYEAFSITPGVTADAVMDAAEEWTVQFSTDANWYGYAWFVVRGTDPGGALVETAAELTVLSVPDAPVLAFNETIEVQTGVQKAVDLYAWAKDADAHDQGLEFSVSSTYAAYATVMEGVLVLEFPDEFLEGEDERAIEISISASDPDGLHDTDTLSVVVVGSPEDGGGQWLLAGMVAMGAVAAGSFAIALTLRKRPFVIKDIMVIHNDGFLIGRAAEKAEGEIDEDVLSGMLTAVLNFVEDSMAKTQDGLRSFGFERYKALVKRGKMTYMAVVYEGDAPEGIEESLGEFLAKVEKIYRKRIENWTGDIDTDFAGIEVLLQAFVKEHSRKANGLGDGKARANGAGDNGKDAQAKK